MIKTIAAICIGASLGAILRWALGISLNFIYPSIPLGTLTANLIGGYCMGIAIAFFAAFPHINPEWRLLTIIGFLGSLTTFSSFSAEVCLLLQQQRPLTAMTAIALHVCGSLAATFLGIGTFSFFKNLS
jgi:CrcB protein